MLKNPYNTSRARNVLESLRLSGQSQDQLLVAAVKTFLERSASKEEQAWVDRIESLRKQLSESTDKVKVIEWGIHKDMPPGSTVDRDVSQVCKAAATPPLWGMLMFALVRQFKPSVCLEMGTSLGISAAYQGAALTLNGKGKLVTMEGAPGLAELAAKNWRQLGISCVEVVPGRFQETLPPTLDQLGSIDFAFIDGHHEEKATLDYFEQILPYLSNNAVVVFDDIAWSAGMRAAWSGITSNSNVRTSLDLSKAGICLLDRGNASSAPKARLAWEPSRWQRAVARIGFAS